MEYQANRYKKILEVEKTSIHHDFWNIESRVHQNILKTSIIIYVDHFISVEFVKYKSIISQMINKLVSYINEINAVTRVFRSLSSKR